MPRNEPSQISRPWSLLIKVALGLVVLLIAVPFVDGNRATALESFFFHAVNSLPGFFYLPAWVVMQFGNLLALPLAAVISALMRRFRLALAFVAVMVAKLYVAQIVKDNVERQRPASVIEDVIRRGDTPVTGRAFVSGHAMVAFAIATLVTPYLPRPWRIVAWTLATLVCLGRVYVGAHMPLDVIGGAALGWSLGSLANYVFGIPTRHAPSSPSPGPGEN